MHVSRRLPKHKRTCTPTCMHAHMPIPLCKGCGVRDPLGGQTEDDFNTIWGAWGRPLRRWKRRLFSHCHVFRTVHDRHTHTHTRRVVFFVKLMRGQELCFKVRCAHWKRTFRLQSAVKTQAVVMPQWFILMVKLLIYQITFQSAGSCAETGPRKDHLFVWKNRTRICKIIKQKEAQACFGSSSTTRKEDGQRVLFRPTSGAPTRLYQHVRPQVWRDE